MKKQIRFRTFETNSSNMNSLTVMTKAEYEEFMRKWDSDDWLWDCWDVEIVEYTSPSGDELVALSIYGNDNY